MKNIIGSRVSSIKNNRIQIAYIDRSEYFSTRTGGADPRGTSGADSGEAADSGASAPAVSGPGETSGASASSGASSGSDSSDPAVAAADPGRRSCWRHLCARFRTRSSLSRSSAVERPSLGSHRRRRASSPRLRSRAWSRVGTRLRPRLRIRCPSSPSCRPSCPRARAQKEEDWQELTGGEEKKESSSPGYVKKKKYLTGRTKN